MCAGVQSLRFLWSSPGANLGSAPPRAPPPPPAWTAGGVTVSAPRTQNPSGSPPAPRARYVTQRDTAWHSVTQRDTWVSLRLHMYLEIRVTVTETAWPHPHSSHVPYFHSCKIEFWIWNGVGVSEEMRGWINLLKSKVYIIHPGGPRSEPH